MVETELRWAESCNTRILEANLLLMLLLDSQPRTAVMDCFTVLHKGGAVLWKKELNPVKVLTI